MDTFVIVFSVALITLSIISWIRLIREWIRKED